ncbi:DMT family protein [Sinisalibacter aestuarii]|uniref:Membrane protein n=1 Tax=Sinisalibacter aestuarii TaxID=2949426 RepID=A0ABQ5LXW3_9RHOB|nr:DMT family protein [Sinisalibacter aestuarii]GKY89805.1 membrane protein [Sinisalibacter aestuarii]
MTLSHVLPLLLLIASNLFMTLAWYGHLAYPNRPLMLVIVASWLIAFIEYTLAVPANRIGHRVYSAAELKTIQEVVSLTIFLGFSALWLKEPVTLNHVVGFAFILLGAGIVFRGPF